MPDALRALALLAVLVVNALGYLDAPHGPALGLARPAEAGSAAVTQALVAGLLQGKGYPLLAFLFGLSMLLAARGRAPDRIRARGLQRRRRLLSLGAAHGTLVYFGDILTLYALVGRRLHERLRLPWRELRRHLRRAVVWALLAKLAFVGLHLLPALGQGLPALPDPPGLAGVGSLGAFITLNAGTYLVWLVGSLLFAGPVVYLCMLAGVAAGRLRLLTHRRWRAGLGRVALVCGPPLLAANLALGVAIARRGADPAASPGLSIAGELLYLPLAAVLVAAVAARSHGGRALWCEVLAPLGQRTLTLYVGHGLLCAVLYSGAGLGLQPPTWQVAALAVLLWGLALGLANRWPQRRGPLEAWMARP